MRLFAPLPCVTSRHPVPSSCATRCARMQAKPCPVTHAACAGGANAPRHRMTAQDMPAGLSARSRARPHPAWHACSVPHRGANVLCHAPLARRQAKPAAQDERRRTWTWAGRFTRARSARSDRSGEGVTAFSATRETVGAKNLSLQRIVFWPNAQGAPQSFPSAEVGVYVAQGRVEMKFGERLEHTVRIATGEFVFVPIGLIHRWSNVSNEQAIVVLARSGVVA